MSTILSRKDLRAQVSEKLHEVFAGLKSELGHKKFEKNIKKASKNLVDGIKEDEEEEPVADNKPAPAKKVQVKKVTKKSISRRAGATASKKKAVKKATTRKK